MLAILVVCAWVGTHGAHPSAPGMNAEALGCDSRQWRWHLGSKGAWLGLGVAVRPTGLGVRAYGGRHSGLRGLQAVWLKELGHASLGCVREGCCRSKREAGQVGALLG